MSSQVLRTRIAIVGGGLSGLYAAYLLERQGITDYVLVEAADQLGGRILSLPALPQALAPAYERVNRVDLGPTWYWPELQPALQQLIDDLGLNSFAQFDAGEMIVERSNHGLPVKVSGYASSPTAMRLQGGMQTLTEALFKQVDASRIRTGHRVLGIKKTDYGSQIHIAQGTATVELHVEQVLLALPPRLVAQNIEFSPPLPQSVHRQWHNTATWMAPHAKYLAVYENAFWRANGLSGAARSEIGPLVEVHDASMPSGNSALFGFIGVPASTRRHVSESTLREQCRAQLVRLFGAAAATPVHEIIKDWSQTAFTSTQADVDGFGYHAAPIAVIDSGSWVGTVSGIGSEWSTQFPGYLAGAIDAVQSTVKRL